jgi:hypothetical protein
LFDLWNSTPQGFYISLDVKKDFTKAQFNAVGGVNTYLLKFADQLVLLLTPLKHPNKL